MVILEQVISGNRLRNIEKGFGGGNRSAAVNAVNTFDDEVEDELKKLPLKDNNEMDQFERTLRDADYKRKVIFHLSKIGGGNLQATTVNLLKKLLSNAVASEYSLLGKKRKKIFKNTTVFSVILRVVQTNDPAATEDKINEIIAKWLAQASFRLEREKRPIPIFPLI